MTHPDACACGSRYCGNREASYFNRAGYRRSPVRAVVFRWPDRTYWTWCPVVAGEPDDHGQVMGHFRTWRGAFDAARAWVGGVR